MIDVLPIKVDLTIDLTALLIIIGVILFYFGKLINEIKPTKENQFVNYLEGAMFILLFLFLPAVILYTIFGTGIPKIGWIFAIIIQIVLLYFINMRYQIFTIQRVNLKEYLEKRRITETNKALSNLGLNKTQSGTAWSQKAVNLFFYRPLKNPLVFLIIIALEYVLTYSILFSEAGILISFLSLLFLFLSISILAILYSWSQIKEYQQAKIFLIDKDIKPIEGNLLKIEEGFVTIVSKNKIYNIKDTAVAYIERLTLKNQ